MLSKLSKREKYMLYILAGLVVAYGYLQLLLLPVFKDIGAVNQNIANYNQQISTQNLSKITNAKNKKELDEVKGKMSSYEASVPAEERNPEIAYYLKTLMDKNKVSLSSLSFGQAAGSTDTAQNNNAAANTSQTNPQSPQGGASKVKNIPVTLTVSGQYASITQFISEVEHGSRLIEVQTINMSGSKGNIQANISLNIFYMESQSTKDVKYDFNKGTYGSDNPFQ